MVRGGLEDCHHQIHTTGRSDFSRETWSRSRQETCQTLALVTNMKRRSGKQRKTSARKSERKAMLIIFLVLNTTNQALGGALLLAATLQSLDWSF